MAESHILHCSKPDNLHMYIHIKMSSSLRVKHVVSIPLDYLNVVPKRNSHQEPLKVNYFYFYVAFYIPIKERFIVSLSSNPLIFLPFCEGTKQFYNWISLFLWHKNETPFGYPLSCLSEIGILSEVVYPSKGAFAAVDCATLIYSNWRFSLVGFYEQLIRS